MRGQVAQEVVGGELARVEMTPFGEKVPRDGLIATLERGADVGEVVAELAKAERKVEHSDVENEAEQAVDSHQPDVCGPAGDRRNEHGDEPDDPGVAVL